MNKWLPTDIKKGGKTMLTCKCECCDKDIFERKDRIGSRVSKLCRSCNQRKTQGGGRRLAK